MLRKQRDEVRERLAVVSPARLRDAITQVLDLDAQTQASCTDNPKDVELGWYADGVDTAAARLYEALVGGSCG